MFRKKQGGGDADDVNVTYKAPFPIEGAAVENGGRKYRLAGKKECLAFRNYADSIDGFTERYNKRNDVIVWTKKIKDEPLHLVKVFSIYPGVAPETMYDMLQDSVYRAIWDTHRIHAFCIAQLDSNNDIGYYAARSPVPGVAHRDFVNQRSWRSVGDGEFVIFNTSVPHRDVPWGT
ncbi:START domain [Trypanosoma vivax]|nr:START domain [Trypanosoma vivax]